MATLPPFPNATDPEHKHTVISKKDRRLQLVKLVIIAIVSAATVVLTVIDVVQTANIYKKKQKLCEKMQISIETASVIHNLQKERGLTALFLMMKLQQIESNEKKMQKFRENTNKSISSFKKWGSFSASETKVSNSASFLKMLQSFRSKIDNKSEDIHVIDHLRTYSNWINELISWLPKYTAGENLDDYAYLVFAYQMIIQSKEEAAMERALGGMYFIEGKNFSAANTSWYNEKRIRASNYLSIAFSFSAEVKNIFNKLINKVNTASWMKELEAKRKLLVSGYTTKPSKNNALEWFHLMTQYNNLMLEIQVRDGNLIREHVSDEIQLTLRSLVVRSLLLCFTLIVVPCLVVSLAKVQNAFFKYTLSLIDKVDLEQGRTEFLMRENARYVEDLSLRWKSFSKDTLSKKSSNAEPSTEGHTSSCVTTKS